MPIYDVDLVQLGKFTVESDIELSDQQALQAAMTQAMAEATATPTQPASFLERSGRRLKEAGAAALDIPSAGMDLVSGGGKGRFDAALRLLRGAFSPLEAISGPTLGASVEHAAAGFGATEPIAESAGSLIELPFALGLGLLAKAGKLGPLGVKLARAYGVGRLPGLEEQLKHDPHLRFALSRKPGPAGSELEALARTPLSIEELAMKAKSPVLAQISLQQHASKADEWAEWAKANQIIGEVPDSPSLKIGEYIEVQQPRKNDINVFHTLGTPTNVAVKMGPVSRDAALEMGLAEMNIAAAKNVRQLRTRSAILGISDRDMAAAVNMRESGRTHAESMALPEHMLLKGAKKALDYIDNHENVDLEIIKPRLRADWTERITPIVERELTAKSAAWKEKAEPVDIAAEVQRRVREVIPDDWGVKMHLRHIWPGQFLLRDKQGQLLGSARTLDEFKYLVYTTAADLKMSADDLVLDQRVFFDNEFLRFFNSRVSRSMQAFAKGAILTDAEKSAAVRGEFRDISKDKFYGALMERGKSTGYTKDFITIMDMTDAGMERWMQLSDLSQKVSPAFQELNARGYPLLSKMLQASLKSLWGYRVPLSGLFDNLIAGTPGLRAIVAPQALDRIVSGAKLVTINAMLRFNPRYHALNSTQLVSTLWPILPEGGAGMIVDAAKLWRSPEGTALLARHNISESLSRVEGFAKGLGPPERMNQQVSFLTMYNMARQLGLDDVQAAAYGKTRGNIYSQFLGLTVDQPWAFRTLDPMGVFTMFQRFPVKQLEQVLDLVKDRNFPGIAKFLTTYLLLGGFRAATLGGAGWLTYDVYKKIEREYGKPAADLFHLGLPGLLGVDMSSSVMMYNPPFGDTISEKLGNIVSGPILSTAGSILGAAMDDKGVEPLAAKRALNAVMQRIPLGRSVDGLVKVLTGDYNFRDTSGRLRFEGDAKDAIRRMMGARVLKEVNLELFASALREVMERRDDVLDFVASRYGQAQLSGVDLGADMQKAIQKEVDNWNSLWPEFPITGTDITTRAVARRDSAMQDLRTRLLKNAPAALRKSPEFQPGGG